MAYRNGTYVAFHANGTTEPTESDIKYYNLLKAWHEHEDIEFSLIDSHIKSASVRDSSKRATLERALLERLRNSKNMILIIGKTTKEDKDWIPFEIRQAVETYHLPLIIAYTAYKRVCSPVDLSFLWPMELEKGINDGSAKAIHIPFKKEPIKNAISRFNTRSLPESGLIFYTMETYRKWGLGD
jgi:hypothetical protein